jgi:hypothetical protein
VRLHFDYGPFKAHSYFQNLRSGYQDGHDQDYSRLAISAKADSMWNICMRSALDANEHGGDVLDLDPRR